MDKRERLVEISKMYYIHYKNTLDAYKKKLGDDKCKVNEINVLESISQFLKGKYIASIEIMLEINCFTEDNIKLHLNKPYGKEALKADGKITKEYINLLDIFK